MHSTRSSTSRGLPCILQKPQGRSGAYADHSRKTRFATPIDASPTVNHACCCCWHPYHASARQPATGQMSRSTFREAIAA
ncbi:hypothetical protein MTO96_007591 [Rhipicephalus appendiculatus]